MLDNKNMDAIFDDFCDDYDAWYNAPIGKQVQYQNR
jgi:hypothetical protein